jgi:acetoin utilization deacetylase AcuC-like enzyme
MNIPVKANTNATEQSRMFEAGIEDVAKNFRPDLIFISAGFDAHLTDPLGQLRLEDDDYAAMTHVVKEWGAEVCGGRIVSCLEGGYNLDTLGRTVKNHVTELSR